MVIWGRWCEKQVYRVWLINYIPQHYVGYDYLAMPNIPSSVTENLIINHSQMARFMGPTWGPPGSCRPQVGPMLAPRTLLSGLWKKGFPVPECYLQVAISSAARVHRDCWQTGVAGCGGSAGCPAGCSAGWRAIRANGHTHSDMGICASASASRGVGLKDIRMTSHKRYSFSNHRPSTLCQTAYAG